MTESADPEADRIERDLARTRARLDATIGALQDKLSPGQMVDQAVGYLKESGGGEFGRNMMVAVRDNPVPVALVGIGVAWLMATSARGARPAAGPPGGGGGGPRREALERYERARDRYRTPPPPPPAATGGGGRTAGAYAAPRPPAPAPTPGAAGGGSDDPGLEGRLARGEGYLTQRGAYASAAAGDLAAEAERAGGGVARGPGEADEAHRERVYAAKGAVLGLRRNEDEPHAGFRARVEAALAAAAERYGRAARAARAGATGGNIAAGGRSAMQNISDYGRAAAGYGQAAAEGAYDYGQVAVRNVRENPVVYALIGAGAAGLALYLMTGRRDEAGERRRAYEAMRYYAGRGPDLGPGGGGAAGYGDDRYAYQADRGGVGYGGPGYGGVAGYAGATRGGPGGAGYGAGAGGGPGAGYGYDYAGEPVEDLASRAHAAGSAVSRDDDEDDEAYGGRVYAARGKELGIAQQAGEALAAFRERVDAALAAAGERYAAWRDRAASAASGAASRGQGAVQGFYGYGRGAAGRAGRAGGQALGYVQDQPWIMGLMGLAAGAALAMLAPPSRYERDAMRGVGEDLGGRLRDMADDALEGAGRVAREVADAARESAEREGLTDLVAGVSVGGVAQAAREKVQDAAERVRHVVEETAAAGRAAVERELAGGGDGDEGGTQGGGVGGAAAGGARGVGGGASGTSTTTTTSTT